MFGLFAFVCIEVLFVEIVEQEIEENGIWHCEDDRPSWVSTFGVQQLSTMYESHTELDLFVSKQRNFEKIGKKNTLEMKSFGSKKKIYQNSQVQSQKLVVSLEIMASGSIGYLQ